MLGFLLWVNLICLHSRDICRCPGHTMESREVCVLVHIESCCRPCPFCGIPLGTAWWNRMTPRGKYRFQ